MPIQAITTLIISITLYPLLRTTVLKPTPREVGRTPETALESVRGVSPNQIS